MNRNLSIYLDLVRLCAALGVFLGHARRFLDPELSKLVATHATECVAIFFVMSGFVIRHVTRDSAAGLTSYGLDRAARMWSVVAPAILVTLAADRIGASINPAFYQTLEFWDGTGRFAEILTSLLFLNEAWGVHVVAGSNEPYWSLGYEVAYYIGFGLTFLRSNRNRWIYFLIWAAVFGPQIVAYGTLWLLGILAYELCLRGQRWTSDLKTATAWALLAAPLFYPVLKYLVFPPIGSPMRFESLTQWSVGYVYFLGIAALFSMHFVGCAMLCPSRSWLPSLIEASIRWAAGATFTIYLMHQPIIILMGALNDLYPSAWLSGLGGVLLAVALLFVLAEVGERRKRAWRRALDWLVRTLFRKRILTRGPA